MKYGRWDVVGVLCSSGGCEMKYGRWEDCTKNECTVEYLINALRRFSPDGKALVLVQYEGSWNNQLLLSAVRAKVNEDGFAFDETEHDDPDGCPAIAIY